MISKVNPPEYLTKRYKHGYSIGAATFVDSNLRGAAIASGTNMMIPTIDGYAPVGVLEAFNDASGGRTGMITSFRIVHRSDGLVLQYKVVNVTSASGDYNAYFTVLYKRGTMDTFENGNDEQSTYETCSSY